MVVVLLSPYLLFINLLDRDVSQEVGDMGLLLQPEGAQTHIFYFQKNALNHEALGYSG